MTQPTTTVIIPTIGRPSLLERCLTSILDGDRRPDRIIVCDQSADDATADVVRSLRSAVPITYLRLAVAAVSAARNAGNDAADTDLVIFIDDDCIAAQSWLGSLVDAYVRAADREGIAAVAGAVLPLVSRAGAIAVSSRTSMTERTFRATDGNLDRAEWAPWDVGTGGNLLVRRASLLAVGGFDTSLGPGTPGVAAEDVDLLYRLARVGALVYMPTARVHHPATTRSKRLRSRVRYGRGMGAMLARRSGDGDAAATALTWLYLRHQLAQGLRSGPWGPVESALTLLGAAAPIAGALTGRLRQRPGSR